jgi:hypothetical protein
MTAWVLGTVATWVVLNGITAGVTPAFVFVSAPWRPGALENPQGKNKSPARMTK